MTDPRQEAQQVVRDLLLQAERKSLGAGACSTLAEQVQLVPGYLKRVAHALSAQRTPCAVDALLVLPPNVPGVVEGLYQAFAHGVSRIRLDGRVCTPMLALDFRQSRSRTFEDVLSRAQALFADSFESLKIGGHIHHRIGLEASRGTLAGRASALAHDLQWLHGRLAKLKGTRLWINGWAFPSEGPIRGSVQIHLLRAWLTWAATQTQTRA